MRYLIICIILVTACVPYQQQTKTRDTQEDALVWQLRNRIEDTNKKVKDLEKQLSELTTLIEQLKLEITYTKNEQSSQIEEKQQI